MMFWDLTFEYDKKTAARLLDRHRDIISFEEMRDLYVQIRHIDDATVELANSLAPEAGYYLSAYEIEALVKADITASDAMKIVIARRIYLSRLSKLLIPILSFFPVGADRIASLATSVDESAHGYWQAVRRERKDRKRRQLVKQMKRTTALCKEMLDCLQEIPYSVSADFDEFRSAFLQSAYNAEDSNSGIETFRRDIELFYACSEISIVRAENNLSGFWVAENGGKRHIVESTFELCRSFDGPKFVTTPNSEFSRLCSILYELASGNRDEGFAGAVSSFARSEEKKLWDESELQADCQPDGPSDNEDNFLENKGHIDEISKKFDSYREIAEVAPDNGIVQNFIVIILRDLVDRIVQIKDRYGPHLVWASRMKVPSNPDNLKACRELLVQYRQTAIELGNARRGQSS